MTDELQWVLRYLVPAVFAGGAAWASVRFHLNGLRKDVTDVGVRQKEMHETANVRQREMYQKIYMSDQALNGLRVEVSALSGKIDTFTEMESSRVMVVQDVQKRTSYLEGKVAVLFDRDERQKGE